MKRAMGVSLALLFVMATGGTGCCDIPAQSRPIEESSVRQVGKYDPSFWVFNDPGTDQFESMRELGFMGVTFWAANRDGEGITYSFDSPTLRQFEWAKQSEDQEQLTEYAARAHAAGLKVMVNMEGVNPYHWKAGRRNWTPEVIGAVMADLHRDGGDRWFTECVAGWPKLFSALADTGRRIGMEYQEGDDPTYLYSFDEDTGRLGFPEIYSRGQIVSMYHYHYGRDELGEKASLAQEGTLAYAFARGWQMPTAMVFTVHHNWGELPEYWEGLLAPSIAIRALQFRVDDVMLIGLRTEQGRKLDVPATKRWVDDLVARNAGETRPLLNVVVHLRPGVYDQWKDLTSSGDAITSGAFHAGWDVVASTEPVPGADGYYVATAGRDAEGTLDLTPGMAKLFEGEKPVFLQVVSSLPSGADLTPNWRTALAACGVNPEADFSAGEMPRAGLYKGEPFTYAGLYTAYEVSERRHGTLIPRAAVTGTVSAEGDGVPLIVSNDNKHLIPGNCVRWQMMGPISDLLAGCGVKGSSDVWGIAGENATVLLATQDTRLDLVIPGLAKGAKIRVTQWDKHHEQTYQETVTYAGSYQRDMSKFDSIEIVKLGPPSASAE